MQHLGVELNNRLIDHIVNVCKKASTRQFFIAQLYRTKMDAEYVVKFYTLLVRPLTEYASWVWHPVLTLDYHDLI